MLSSILWGQTPLCLALPSKVEPRSGSDHEPPTSLGMEDTNEVGG